MVAITGGKKFEAALARIAKQVTKAARVEVGFPEGSTHTDPVTGKITSLPMIAAIQEFGASSRGIPPRPFMRNTVSQYSKNWPAGLMAALKANDYDTAKALAVLGDQIRGEMVDSILSMNSPALSPVTVMLRGMRGKPQYRDMSFGELIKQAIARVTAGKTNYGASTKPLVDTGELLAGIVFNVKE